MVFLTTRRMGIKCSPMKAEICPVCGWRGVILFHAPQRCAYLLRLREMRESGLGQRAILRELGISRAALYKALRRLGLSTNTPRRTSEAQS
jgi:hypothetical protein